VETIISNDRQEEKIMEAELEQLNAIYQTVTEFFINYSFQLVGALIIIMIGFWLGNRLAALILRLCERSNLDITLSKFLASVAKFLFVAVMIIIALGKIGISIGPFVAALGAISLGAGLAIQSPLSNYGAGLNLVITRPFVVGDTISVQGVTGIVEEIRLAYTLLTDEDGVQILIPNKHIIGEVIHNSQGNTLIELEIGVSYHADPVQAASLIKETITKAGLTSENMAVQVGIDTFGDSNINIAVRLWAPTDKHFQIRFRANSAIYQALKEANIEIAFPQREVRMLNASNNAVSTS
jgi:small conductance mechanosensitive channel